MAIFPSATVGSIEKNDDIAKVNQYLRKLNDDLTYMFNNLTPDDNWSASAPKLIYSVDENGEASFEISSSGIRMRVASDEYVKSNVEILDNKISLKVSLGDVVNQVNSELLITGNSIALTTGHFTVNSTNLTIDSAGNATFSGALSAATGTFAGALSAATGTFSGALTGGTIAIGGTTANPAMTVDQYGNLDIGDNFSVDYQGNLTALSGTFRGSIAASTDPNLSDRGLTAGSNFYVAYDGYSDYDIGVGHFYFSYDASHGHSMENYTGSSSTFFCIEAGTGDIYCREIYPWTSTYQRWNTGLVESVELLWEEVFGGGGGGGGGDEEPDDSELDGPVEP